MATFFTSDLHLGHKNILNFGRGKKYASIQEHDDGIILNWNTVVNNNDEIYVLGDVSLYTNIDFLRNILSKLNGKKHLVFGNHDKVKLHAQLKNEGIWETINEYLEITRNINDKKYRLILSHFPILEFNHAFRENTIHLYGHIHDMHSYDCIYQRLNYKALHIGLDTSDMYPNTAKYFPISLENILIKTNLIYGDNK